MASGPRPASEIQPEQASMAVGRALRRGLVTERELAAEAQRRREQHLLAAIIGPRGQVRERFCATSAFDRGAPPVGWLSSFAVSDKRHRQQPRRQRRRASGGSPSTAQRGSGASSATALRGSAVDRELAKLMKDMAEITVTEAREPRDVLEAEQWASCIVGTWHVTPLLEGDVEELFFPAYVSALEELGSAGALATLRAMSGVGAAIHARRARAAADRLAAGGLGEPPWAEGIGRSRPVGALLMYEEAFEDGVSVIVEFAAPGAQPHTLGIYIDHNMGGLVKDVFLAGPLSEVRRKLGRRAPNGVGLALRELDLAEARARVEDALEILDHTYDPPVDGDVRTLRALIEARMRLLPAGAVLADEVHEFEPAERERLLADFLDSPEGRRWRGDEDAEDAVATAIDFGCDYNHGGPLRWSPVVVEIFMTSWLTRKVVRDPEFFRCVPDVLPDWVAYAGRRREVPAAPLREAVDAVKRYRKEMLAAASDPDSWGPAKAFAVAAQAAGVDLSDPDAVGEFVERYNDGLAA